MLQRSAACAAALGPTVYCFVGPYMALLVCSLASLQVSRFSHAKRCRQSTYIRQIFGSLFATYVFRQAFSITVLNVFKSTFLTVAAVALLMDRMLF